MTNEKPNAIFCDHGPKNWQTHKSGTLEGSRLAVKDLFAVAGERNGAGNPDWFQQTEPAKLSSFAVDQLMAQGCQFVGFTHTDELAYSLEGNNIHYGAAENPKLKGHACGGSSMGSAAAVANDLAEIGLGTDTGGSIRVPASYCGLFGIRPSHGIIKNQGLTPLAPAFDTTGWFCQSPRLLEQVGDVLLPEQPKHEITELFVIPDLFDLVDPKLVDALKNKLNDIKPYFKKVTIFELENKQLLPKLADAFRVLQGREIAKTHGDWVRNKQPNLSPVIAQRFEMALSLTDEEEQQALLIQQEWKNLIQQKLSANSVLFLPTTPTTAPKLGVDTSDLRMQILTLTAIAGLSGSAQVHLPLIDIEQGNQQAPYGFSLLMSANNDKSLLTLVASITKHLSLNE